MELKFSAPCRRGENWVWQEIKKEEEEERLASLTQGGILHFRNNEGVFKVKGTVSRVWLFFRFEK